MLKDKDEKTKSKFGCKAFLKHKERVYELIVSIIHRVLLYSK